MCSFGELEKQADECGAVWKEVDEMVDPGCMPQIIPDEGVDIWRRGVSESLSLRQVRRHAQNLACEQGGWRRWPGATSVGPTSG